MHSKLPLIRHIVIFFIAILLLPACGAPHSIISLEILEPASITYPEDVQKVGYLNRSPRTLASFHSVNVRSLNDTDLFIIDTIVCSSLRRGFEDGKGEARLSYLDDIDYLEARRNDTLFRDKDISAQKVEEICNIFGLDALITQDYYSFKFDEIKILNYENSRYEDLYFLFHETKWTISIPGRSKPLDVYTLKDTLLYGNQSKSGRASYLTPMEMLTDGAHVIGYAFGKRNVPDWTELNRTVYVGRQAELRKAAKYTDKGDWERAHHLWSQNLSSEDKKLAAKSAHNIAVYYELEDEIEQAMAFSQKAFDLWPSESIESYKQELLLRVLNKKDIFKQLRVADQ